MSTAKPCVSARALEAVAPGASIAIAGNKIARRRHAILATIRETVTQINAIVTGRPKSCVDESKSKLGPKSRNVSTKTIQKNAKTEDYVARSRNGLQRHRPGRIDARRRERESAKGFVGPRLG